MNVENLKKKIDALVALTAPESITPAVMGNVLTIIADLLNKAAITSGMQFAGVAVPGTNPGTPDGNVFYIATEKGTYANFGGITLDGEKFAVLVYDGTWKKQEVDTAGVFRTWLSQFTTKPGDTRLVGEAGGDVAFEVDAKADKVEIVAPTLNLIAPDDDPYKVTAATLPGATAQAAGVMTAEQVRNLGKALAKVGFAGNINFNGPDFYQNVEMAQGWYTLPEGLYTVEGEAFSGMMLITKSATTHLDGGRNVIIDSEPSFFFVGNAKFVTYDKADTDITKDVANGDGFSVYTKMEATNDIQMVEYSAVYAITRFEDIENTKELVDILIIFVVKLIATPIVTEVGKVIPSASDVSFDVTTADMNVAADEDIKTTTEKMTIPPATTEKAGVMSAKDKDTLDTLASQGTLHDLFISLGATYDKESDRYTYCDNTGLTLEDLEKAYYCTYNWWLSPTQRGRGSSDYTSRAAKCIFRPMGYINTYYNTYNFNQAFCGMYVKIIDLSAIDPVADKFKIIKVNDFSFCFQGTPAIQEIRNVFEVSSVKVALRTSNGLSNCSLLLLQGLCVDAILTSMPNLNKRSILFVVTNAKPSKAITVTLHPTAYAMATADAEIQAALQAQPLVSLAEEVPNV